MFLSKFLDLVTLLMLKVHEGLPRVSDVFIHWGGEGSAHGIEHRGIGSGRPQAHRSALEEGG